MGNPISIYPERRDWLTAEFMGARGFFWVAAGITDVMLMMHWAGVL